MSFQRQYNFSDALEAGDIYTMKYILRTHGWGRCTVPSDACTRSARLGNLEVLYWLRDEGCTWNAAEIAEAATQGGHRHILEHMRRMGDAVVLSKHDRTACILANMDGLATILV